jgi:AcrR family transcriptional regulator
MQACRPRKLSLVPPPDRPSPLPASNLLDAARDIFVSEGIKGLSVRRVAERAGCTTMAVYTHYSNKEGLLGALFDEGFEQLARAQSFVDATMPAASRVLALCNAYRETAQRYPHHYALMLGSFSGEHMPTPQSSAKAMATLSTLVAAVATGLPLSADGTGKATEVANRLFAYCHGWVSLERLGFFAGAPEIEDAFQQGVRALLRS